MKIYEKVDIISLIEADNPYFDYEIAYNSPRKTYFCQIVKFFQYLTFV